MPSTAADQGVSSPPAAMTIHEFCKWSRLGRTATYREIKAGRLVVRKVGAKTIVLVTEAERWLNALPTA